MAWDSILGRKPVVGTCDLRSGERWKYMVILVSEGAKHDFDMRRLLVFSFQRLRLRDDDLSLPQSKAVLKKKWAHISNEIFFRGKVK